MYQLKNEKMMETMSNQEIEQKKLAENKEQELPEEELEKAAGGIQYHKKPGNPPKTTPIA